MSTHNICFRGEIRKIFIWFSLLSTTIITIIRLVITIIRLVFSPYSTIAFVYIYRIIAFVYFKRTCFQFKPLCILDALSNFYAIFFKGDNFVTSQGVYIVWKWASLKGKNSLPLWEKPKSRPLFRRGQISFERVASTENIAIPHTSHFIIVCDLCIRVQKFSQYKFILKGWYRS